NPAVLRKRAVRPLGRRQPDQCTQRRSRLSCGEERACALHEIARPDEMITAEIQITLGFPPGDAHRSDDCALENFVLMRQQHAAAQPIHAAVVASVFAEVEFGIYDGALPLSNVCLAM